LNTTNRTAAALVALGVLLSPICLPFLFDGQSGSGMVGVSTPRSEYTLSAGSNESIPVRRVTFVAHDDSSYLDDFAYIAAVPSSICYSGGTRYISPLLYTGSSDAEKWLLDDWSSYLSSDGGTSEVVSIGNLSQSEIYELQDATGARVYPQITGSTSSEFAAKIALNDWRSADTVVLSLSKDDFVGPQITNGSTSYTFSSPVINTYQTSVVVNNESSIVIPFTPPAETGWIDAAVNWTGSEIFTHILKDPQGRAVDYSVYRQVIFERNPSAGYVTNPLPLYSWVPMTSPGEWSVVVSPQSLIQQPVNLDATFRFYPGLTRTITVPADAKWLNITANWDNAGTTINLALVDPNGRMIMWAPAESLLGGAGSKSMQVSYPSPGDWTLVGAWADPAAENNKVDITWQIETIPDDLQPYLESAANGAVVASLLNAPLLYVNADSVPSLTSWTISHLGATNCILVDPADLHTASLTNALSSLLFVSTVSTYPMLSNMISSLSGKSGVVLTVPLGNADELFAPAAYSGAYHGAVVYSLCGDNNAVTTCAEETWAPYLIGPQIHIFVQERYSTKTENGWYDERIPNVYSMDYSANQFEQFLSSRGALNLTTTQATVIVAPVDLIMVSLDRSLQSHFSPGRIPATDSISAAVMINNAALHRFLFGTSENAGEALLSLYAYTISYSLADNFGTPHTVNQIDNSVTALTDAGFSVSHHVGVDAVFAGVASQVALWSFSTHGTLTEYPTDPPERPDGLGMFSLRTEDTVSGYGQETSTARDANGDGLVNPVLYQAEAAFHTLKTTTDLEAAIGNIGSPIVVLTACLLGGSELPIMLMEHGAVAVTASPRTVYFVQAGLLSDLFTASIAAGNTTGESLSSALRATSYDYTNPLPGTPIDYANQQVLFGDPDVCLYAPSATPRIASVNPGAISLGGHLPGRGVREVAGLGISSYLPDIFSDLSVDYDYYELANYSEFLTLLDFRDTVILEPSTLSDFSGALSNNAQAFTRYVKSGGTLILMGMNQNGPWADWNITYVDTPVSSGYTILETEHPLLTVPNSLSASVPCTGAFSGVSANLTVLATTSSGIAIAAGVYGAGKVAVTTTTPTGDAAREFIENALAWNNQPSLLLRSLSKNEEIIWTGDRLTLTALIANREGQGVDNVAVRAWVNSTEIAVTALGSGRYQFVLNESWTSGSPGYHSVRLVARAPGYDTLSVTLLDFFLIRVSPLPLLLIIFGSIAAVIIAWQYKSRKSRPSGHRWTRQKKVPESETREERRLRELADKERQRKTEEEDKKFDAKEYFGVD
jgi:hypothetical protein